MVFKNKISFSIGRKTKKEIISRFKSNVLGRKPDVSSSHAKHDGKHGHWLEKAMGLTINGDNAPDFDGFEMKNNTKNKTTFGDWSADWYIFKGDKKTPTESTSNYSVHSHGCMSRADSRDSDFLIIFGKPNEKKQGRYSWAGEPAPSIVGYNKFGQKLVVDENENILAVYSFSEDKRLNKNDIVPGCLKKDNQIIAQWNRDSIKEKLENKFNQKGWFKCLQNKEGYYTELVFGAPISYGNWIQLVKEGKVYLDSGMYQGNKRPYSNWRADNKLWDSLIIERY